MRSIKNKGFTLIELIIYLAIVSIVLVSISFLIIDILSGQTKNNSNQEVNHNLRFMVNLLAKDIRSAQDISSLSSSQLVLTMPGDDITYTFVALDSTLTRQLGINPAEVINTNLVEVIGNFTNLSYGSRSRNVGTSLTVTYKNPGNLPDYNVSVTSEFSTELRNRK